MAAALCVFMAQPVMAVERVATLPGELRIKIDAGTLTAKNGTSLTVTKDSTTYSVTTDANTQLRRRFWGKATLDEMNPGDSVNVIGKWTDDTKTTVLAKLVRDLSIQKRYGVFFGTITAVSGNTWTLNSVNRGVQTVTVSASTKKVNVNDRVRIRGLWDSKLNTITEVTAVKDYSLPVK